MFSRPATTNGANGTNPRRAGRSNALLLCAALLLGAGALARARCVAQKPVLTGARPEHAVLERFVGDFDTRTTLFLPGDSELVSPGRERLRRISGGQWLVQEHESEVGGEQLEGLGLVGYDPLKRAYVAVWVDNQETALAVAEGTWDEASATLTLEVEVPGRTPDQRLVRRSRMTIDGEDRFTLSMDLRPQGAPEAEAVPLLRTLYRRRADD